MSLMPWNNRVAAAGPLALAAGLLLWAGCDDKPAPTAAAEAAAVVPTASAPPEPPRAPEIVIDATTISVGTDRIATGEPGLPDKVAVFVTGRPMIEGQTVSVVAMRNAKPSGPLAVISALRKAKAAAAVIHTDGRDGSTQALPLSFPTTVADCTTVAWIAKDAAIDVWPAGGGTAKRVIKGLAGPDMTLGGEAVRKQMSACAASQVFVGADEGLTWGLVFDLATGALAAQGSHVSSAVIVGDAVPGRKLALP
jgi:hypothetical protein